MFNQENVKLLTNTELKVYEYLVQHTQKVIRMSVREIASETHVSPATVTRTISKLGFENIWECKLHLKEMDNRKHNKKVFETSEIVEEFFSRSMQSEYEEKIQSAVELIANSEVALFFGIGTSGLIAAYAARQFSNLGQSTFHIQDAYYPFHLISKQYTNTVAIVCSVSGETDITLRKVGDLKSLGSKIISITNSSTNSLARQSDINLAYHLTPEYVDDEVNVTSQLPVVFLIETLARRNYNYMQQALNNKQ